MNYWGEDELRILRGLYPRHGIHWEGWESVLPGRTIDAIKNKALQLRMEEPHPKANGGRKMRRAGARERERKEVVLPDPMEVYVLKRLADGCTLKEIDAEKHWPEGRAKMILNERWKRG